MTKTKEQVRAGPIGYIALELLRARLLGQRGFEPSVQDMILELMNRDHSDLVDEARQKVEGKG